MSAFPKILVELCDQDLTSFKAVLGKDAWKDVHQECHEARFECAGIILDGIYLLRSV